MLGRIAGVGALRAGDLVEVLSEQEILGTLDLHGKRDSLPFMPEMLKYCGRRFRVARVAHKTCDTVNYSGIRRVDRSVHLEGLRCDGAAHGGCEAGCLILWKDVWLKRVEAEAAPAPARRASLSSAVPGRCSRESVESATLQPGSSPNDIQYQCQVTELLRASRPCHWWNPRQYLADAVSRNWPVRHVLSVLALATLRRMVRFGTAYRLLVGMHDRLAAKAGLRRYSEVVDQYGTIPKGAQTPDSDLVLNAGDWVTVRPREEIIATLNTQGRNRGMHFDPEMVPYCGGTYRVERLVTRIINEATGRMMSMKKPCIALDGVACRGDYSRHRLLCPRAIIPYWRPGWLIKTAAPRTEHQIGDGTC